MGFITRLFSEEFYINWVEMLTIAAILLLVGYIFYSLNLFKRS